MTTHIAHPSPDERDEFLVDGCARCEEYVENEGVHFDWDRFAAFWAKMVEIEYDSTGAYASDLDRRLGRRLYHLSLQLERAFGIEARTLAMIGGVRRAMAVAGASPSSL